MPHDVVHAAGDALGRQLVDAVGRVGVQELSIGRALLVGGTPEVRFNAFISAFDDPGAIAELGRRFPGLGPLLNGVCARWTASWSRLLRHLRQDAAVLPGPWVTVSDELTSPPRSVRRVGFASGATRLYKSRSLAPEAAWATFIAWMNARGHRPRLSAPEVVDRGDHGWMEDVAHAPCDGPDDVARFYERQGAHLAVFYLLGATDLHRDNLVARGAHPLFVDVETLFQSLPASLSEQPDLERRFGTVDRVGLLPTAEVGTAAGLGEPGTVWSHLPRHRYAAQGTDVLRVTAERVPLDPSLSLPVLDGAPQGARASASHVESGFRSTWAFLATHRAALTDPHGPLAAFRGVTTRYLHRGDLDYAEILHDANHPGLLALPDARRQHLRSLPARDRAEDARLFPFEVDALERGVLPVFSAAPESRDVWTADGTRVEHVLGRSGWDRTQALVRGLDPAGLDDQVRRIRRALRDPGGPTNRT